MYLELYCSQLHSRYLCPFFPVSNIHIHTYILVTLSTPFPVVYRIAITKILVTFVAPQLSAIQMLTLLVVTKFYRTQKLGGLFHANINYTGFDLHAGTWFVNSTSKFIGMHIKSLRKCEVLFDWGII